MLAIVFLVPCLCATQQQQLLSIAVAASSSSSNNSSKTQRSDLVLLEDTLVQKVPVHVESHLDTSTTTNTTSTSTSISTSSMPLLKKKETSHRDARHRSMEEELKLHAQDENQQFMDWCLRVLGIQTSLEIHTFMYYDYMTAILTQPTDYNDDDDDDFETNITASLSDQPQAKQQEEIQWQDPPMIPVRGLRATRNITIGEIIISIPFQALVTVSNTIDQDPVLSRVMGPQARKAYGWTLEQDMGDNTDTNDPSTNVDFFELPLLAMALLHHYKLGTSSPMYPYIQLLRKSPLDAMPFLWDKQKRRNLYGLHPTSSLAKGIQSVARSIRLEMKDMYHAVVDILLIHHPDLFGKPNTNSTTASSSSSASPNLQYDVLDDDEWAFSFENFQWAFAMVNSRHWLLPIVDLDTDPPSSDDIPAVIPTSTITQQQPQRSVDGVPPAEMPTDAWVVGQHDQEGDNNDTGNTAQSNQQQQQQPPRNNPSKTNNNGKPKATAYHSFLAPVADLLNFGPPCTRGRYNQDTHAFDIVASCDFSPGQEVTFWYSDECEEIVMGNYGFTHPMVPKCPTAEDYKLERDKWKQRAANLQTALEDAYEDLDVMDTELQHVQQILANCDLCDKAAQSQHQQEQQHQPQAATPKEPTLTTPVFNQQQRRPQGTVEDGGNYLRNPQYPAPSQIRGGGGNQMSRGTNQRGSDVHTLPRSSPSRHDNQESRSDGRGSRRAPTDDDVERHGVRRMWAGRSGL